MKKTIILLLTALTGWLAAQEYTNMYWDIVTNLNDTRALLTSGDTLYAATGGGLVEYSIPAGTYKALTVGNEITDHNFTAITKSNKDLLILGTQNGTIAFLNPANNAVKEDYSLQGNEIVALYSVNDVLWALTPKMVAVYLYDHASDRFQFRDFYSHFNQSFNAFTDLTVSGQRIFLGSDAGLFYASSNFLNINLKSAENWNLYTTANGLPQNGVLSLLSREDTLYVGTTGGMVQFYQSAFHALPQGKTPAPVSNIRTAGDRIYFQDNHSIYAISKTSYDILTRNLNSTLTTFTVNDQGGIWGALKDRGLWNLASNSRIWFNSPMDSYLGEVMLDSQNRLWVLSSRIKEERHLGFSVMVDGVWHNYSPGGGWRSMGSAVALAEDPEGTVWIGTWGGGIIFASPTLDLNFINNYETEGWMREFSIAGDDTITLAPPDTSGLLLSSVSSNPNYTVVTDIMFDPENQRSWILNDSPQNQKPIIAVNTPGYDPEILNAQNWDYIPFPPNIVVTENAIYSITKDIFGNFWIGTHNSGVVELQIQENGQLAWQNVTENDNLKNNFCWVVAADQDGYVWIGTSMGLNAYFNGTVYDFREDYQPIGLDINDIKVDKDNNKWFATDKGLSLLKASGSPWDKKSWIHLVPMNSELFGDNIYHTNLPSEDVHNVFVDENNGDVYCTTASGLAILRNNPFTTPQVSLDKVVSGPNPFYPGTGLNGYFYIKNITSNSQVKILTSSGQLVRTLDGTNASEILGSQAQWDGRNTAGRLVSSGVYLYLVTNEEGKSASGKVLVIRK